MHDPVLLLVIVGGLCGAWLGRWGWRQYLWLQVRGAPFPENWLAIVRKTLPFYAHLAADEQAQLLAQINRFLFHKRFIGCAGLEVTEEMRVTIAACACLLLLNRPHLGFERVRWIYLYPAEFVVRRTVQDAAGVVSDHSDLLSGEAWHNGRIILAWDAVQRGVYDFNDGRNVVLHEFAHQLDAESGNMNGAPLLRSRGAYGSWAAILSRDFNALRDHAYFGEATVLDTYGASHPAEFFAVATESFFENPAGLAEEYPELYAQLKDYYGVDPRRWHQPGGSNDPKSTTEKPKSAKPKTDNR